MTIPFAQPYDVRANGFYFKTVEQYNKKADSLRNSAGWPVEEFEIQFIEGTNLDATLFEVLSIHQGNFPHFLEVVNAWTEDEKIKVIVAVGEVGCKLNLAEDSPDQFDVDLYEVTSLRDLAVQFVEDGLFGDFPVNILSFLDYDAIARDLSME